MLWQFDFSFAVLFAEASACIPRAWRSSRPAGCSPTGLRLSLGLALVFGTAGLPHILMRFFTVEDAAAARKSVFYATSCVAYFCLVIPIFGFGAVLILMPIRAIFTSCDGPFNKITDLIGGPTWRRSSCGALGGPVLLGFIAAVAFATILAVVAGLDAGRGFRVATTSTVR